MYATIYARLVSIGRITSYQDDATARWEGGPIYILRPGRSVRLTSLQGRKGVGQMVIAIFRYFAPS